MQVNLSPIFNGVTNFDQYAQPLAGGLIYTYASGSTTPLATYATSDGNVPNTNPIVLGSDGKVPSEVWLQFGYNYKFVLTTATGVLVNTYDNIGGILTQVPTSGGSSLPAGCIVIWSGSVGSIPDGWVLCDGTTPGVPDLRNSFVIGAGNNYAVGQVGGTKDQVVVSHNHVLIITDPGHTHSVANTFNDPGHEHYTVNSNASGAEGGVNSSNYVATRGNFGSSYYNYGLAGIGGDANIGRSNRVTTGITVNTSIAPNVTGISGVTQNTGQSGINANLPPYYALAYIYKT